MTTKLPVTSRYPKKMCFLGIYGPVYAKLVLFHLYSHFNSILLSKHFPHYTLVWLFIKIAEKKVQFTWSLFYTTCIHMTICFMMSPALVAFCLFRQTCNFPSIWFLTFPFSFHKVLSPCFISLTDPSIRMPVPTLGKYFVKDPFVLWCEKVFFIGFFECIQCTTLWNLPQATFFWKRSYLRVSW